jgi:hypothetical protein
MVAGAERGGRGVLGEVLVVFGGGAEGKEVVGHWKMEPALMSQSWEEWGGEGQVYTGGPAMVR